MAESNPTQVILTDDGLKIINAQSTADNAASWASKADSAALIAQSKANAAKSAADSSYKYANSEMAVQSTATAKAQETADDAFSKAQAVGSQANSEIAVQSTATAKAQSRADDAFNKAQAVGSQASSEIAVQSTATAKAQSKADDAFSKATTAIDTGKVTSQAVTDLKDGSKLTIAELENGLATKVANSEYASYKTETADLIASKVATKDFSTYKTQTADLIAEKVATKDFSAYQATTAKAISSKVESNDFNTYKSQTANLINDKVSSAKYTSDKTQTDKDIASKVSSDDFSTYKEQTANLIAEKVATKDFSTYKTQTANLIAEKVATKDFTAYQATTAKSIDSKVESKDFNTYKTQTDGEISSKVESSDFQALQTQVDNSAVGTNLLANTADNGVGPVTIQGDTSAPQYSAPMTRNSSYIEMTNATGSELYYRFCNTDSSMHNLKPGQTYTIQGEVYVNKGAVRFRSQYEVNGGWVDYTGCASGDLATNTSGFVKVKYTFTIPLNATAFYLSWQVYNYDASTVFRFRRMKLENGGNATDYSVNPADQATKSQITQLSGEIEQKVNSGDFSSYKTETANLIGSKVSNGDFSTYKEQTADLISAKVATKDFTAYQDTTAKAISSKVESRDFNTYKSQTADAISSKVATKDFSTYKSQTADAINIRVTKKDLIDQINVQAGNTLISSSGQLTLSGKNIYFDTKNPVIIPSANITGTLNGKTINGSTFNAGTKLNQYGNTSYPLTINQDGSVTSTSFETISNEIAALRTVIKDGTVKTNLRGMTPFTTGMYSAADVSLGAGQLALLEGYSTSQDPNFNATGLKTTGYAILDASAGLSLHGTTQAINFSGTDQSQTTGITMNSYGNIYAQPNSAWWRIGDTNGNQIANFGIDRAGSNAIEFKRDLWVNNMGLGTAHQIRSKDGHGIYFTDANSHRVDTYHNNIYYSGSVSKSLLSEKTNVAEADVNYWSNLAMSIDLATYNYKTDDYTDPLRLSGIIDDVNATKEWTLPEAFYARDEDGNIVGIDNGVLLNAVLALSQEQAKQIDQLNSHNMELEARLNKLEAKLNG